MVYIKQQQKLNDGSEVAMSEKDKIQLVQEQAVHTHWDEEKEWWYFSIVDWSLY